MYTQFIFTYIYIYIYTCREISRTYQNIQKSVSGSVGTEELKTAMQPSSMARKVYLSGAVASDA